jgi:ABC-type sugar transport systems, permease components
MPKTMDAEITLPERIFEESVAQDIQSTRRKPLLKTLTPYLFLTPACLGFVVFTFFPFFRTIYLSLFLTNSVGQAKAFRGMQNYSNLFQSADYRTVLLNTVILAAIVIVGAMVLGFITANLANIHSKPFRMFPILFTMPIAASAGSFALLFEKMFDPNMGVINRLFHLDVLWFSDPNVALYTVAIITVWMLSGSNFLYMHAGLRNIPKEILESAEIEGATGLKKLIYIEIPCLSPILFFVLITDIMAAFQVFTQINVITQGGPGNATNVMVYSIYRDAFFNFRFGPAAAQSVILFLIILIITLIQFKNEKRMVNYG